MHTENQNDSYGQSSTTFSKPSPQENLSASCGSEAVAFSLHHTKPTLSDRWEATQYRGGFGLAPLLSSRIQVDYPDRAYSTFISSCSSSLRCRISRHLRSPNWTYPDMVSSLRVNRKEGRDKSKEKESRETHLDIGPTLNIRFGQHTQYT
jgi:hypothetical protein